METMPANNEEEQQLHVAMFPWLAFGHLIPFLELSRHIAEKGHRISFISTPKNIDSLPKLPSHLSPLITFVKLPLPSVDMLPPSAEATRDLAPHDVCYLKKAYDRLRKSLSEFLESSLPDFILFDFVSYWVPDVASKFNIPAGYFSIFMSSTLCYVGSGNNEDYRKDVEDYIVPPNWVPFPTTVTFRLYEVLRNFSGKGITGDDSIIPDIKRFQDTMKNCDFIAVKTFSEFESEWLRLTEQLYQKPVIPTGALPREPDEENETWEQIKQWLDMQEKRSVVYVAFGSEVLPSQEEVTEIAHGLELSELPFLWVFRKSRGLSSDEHVLELPNGFEGRVKKRGMVWASWAPQVNILGHESIGGFLTHCGYSSVAEALQHGRALVLLPFIADQGLNSKVLEEKKIGYLIPRNKEDGFFTRNSLAESLRLVAVEEEGKVYRDKAKEMSELVFGDKDKRSSYINGFLRFLKTRKHGGGVETKLGF